MLVSEIVWTFSPSVDGKYAILMSRDGLAVYVVSYPTGEYKLEIWTSKKLHMDLDALDLQALLYHYGTALPRNNSCPETTV